VIQRIRRSKFFWIVHKKCLTALGGQLGSMLVVAVTIVASQRVGQHAPGG
jgi:hypothetical protein